MTTAGDTFRALADLFDQPEVLARASLEVVKNQQEKLDRKNKRIQKLEDACREMYGRIVFYNDTADRLRFDNRMDELGLLDGGEHE